MIIRLICWGLGDTLQRFFGENKDQKTFHEVAIEDETALVPNSEIMQLGNFKKPLAANPM